MDSQKQMFERAQQRYFDANRHFMDLVNCKENPLMKRDLEALIERNPLVWRRFSSWLDKLPEAE